MDPLAQLKDIHLPEQIHHYPIAIGWWILATLIIVSLIFIVIKIKRYNQIRQAQKQALKHIEQAQSNAEVISTLKWACLQYFPRENVAPLYGASFASFLKTHIPSKKSALFDQTIGEHFTHAYKESSSDLDPAFKNGAILFLSRALPPKTLNKKNLVNNKVNTGASL